MKVSANQREICTVASSASLHPFARIGNMYVVPPPAYISLPKRDTFIPQIGEKAGGRKDATRNSFIAAFDGMILKKNLEE